MTTRTKSGSSPVGAAMSAVCFILKVPSANTAGAPVPLTLAERILIPLALAFALGIVLCLPDLLF